ncbi:phosphotransferase family protein [Arthrobacter sp. ISL-28]|uniref:phosphotransferase family protein n=1 Tax=Arthrobacter sp. ISL-28 TaxID=2819108 RepID=UPI001BE9CF86|nr:phosphotransferase family protein [Arthrobacter sp. ISL-28]MBT2523318.1 phosphotransferase family protein [Arthrobacter sp. ISL-28]
MSEYMLDADPEIGDVRPGDELDWAALERYLQETVGDGLTGPMTVRQFPHGSANLTYLVTFGERRLVVRRPPHGEVPAGAHDMAREYRVLSQLWRSYPRAARALAFCNDPAVIGAEFLVIEYRSGVVIRDSLPESMRAVPGAADAVSAAFIEAVAELHLVDPETCGLGELGRPEGFAERQVRGWLRRWQACRPDDADPTMDEVAALLARDVPEPSRVSLVHSDLKLDNCQFLPGDPTRVHSIFDWDMTTLGDPLIDLGTALSYWPEAGPAGEAARALWPGQDQLGLWSRSQLREHYAGLLGIDVSRIAWYEAFGSWKTAVALQQLANRALQGHTRDARLASYAPIVPVAGRAAMELLRS